MDPSLARLWDVYQKARMDFIEAENAGNPYKKNTAARFLRDSAENALQYLRKKNADPVMVGELEATYKMASSTAVYLADGRKRRWDIVKQGKGHSAQGGESRAAKRRNRRPERRFEAHVRDERPQDEEYERERRYHDDARRKSDRREQARAESAGANRGRGHSGVPFGYSRRSVDSYKPQ